jgi:putative acetyltransferase
LEYNESEGIMNVRIRQEEPADIDEVSRVLERAFGRPDEARLVEMLRRNPSYVSELSLVAESDGIVRGHILLFPVTIRQGAASFGSLSVGPVSVVPEMQRMGVGTRLVAQALRKAEVLGYRSAIVLGYADYYPRFGFRPASIWGIRPPFGVPDESFLAMELKKGGLEGVSGIVEYPEEFSAVSP